MSKLAHSNQPTMDKIEARSHVEPQEVGDTINIDDEATQFAFNLLMPADFVRAEIKKIGNFDLGNEKMLKRLAAKFKVEPQIMALRIGQLMIGRDDVPGLGPM